MTWPWSATLGLPSLRLLPQDQWHGRPAGSNGMRLRWWRPPEDVPDWAMSRAVQVLFLMGISMLIGGIVALGHVRLDPPGLRPYLAAFLGLGACLLVAVLLRAQQVRRRKRRGLRQSPEP